MKKRFAIITLIAVLAAVPIVYAGHGGMRGHGGAGFGLFGRHLAHLADDLDLSEQQRDQIKAIYAELHQQNSQYRDDMHGGFKTIAETLLKNPNDLSAAQALLDQQTAAERAMKANMLAATSKALNVLTAEQRAELSERLAKHGERRMRRSK